MRLTKIVATIGPACESEEMIEKMIEAGVNVFRFNFKHNTPEWHNSMIDRVDSVGRKMKRRVGVLIDLQGPEIRINMKEEMLELQEGELIHLGEVIYKKEVKGFSISHPEIIPHLLDGQKVMADDGAFEFEVVRKNKVVMLLVKESGVLKNRKSLNIPGAEFPFPVLVERDFEGIRLARREEVDFVALSFVRSVSDLEVLKKEMKKYKVKAQVVSKIETEKALDSLEEIIEASDGVMVARGDLGVEMSLEQVPYLQKKVIRESIVRGKFVITATQMLESMIESPHPTRAEVSDVANAVYDLTDAVMLSGESAYGKFPVRAVKTMRRTLEFIESKRAADARMKLEMKVNTTSALVSEAAYEMFLEMSKKNLPLKGYLVYTHTGKTARLLSAYRPGLPIFALCPNSVVAESLQANYGVYPIVRGKSYKKNVRVTHNHVLAGIKYLWDKGVVERGDQLIVLHGDFWAVEGGTSTLKLVKVDKIKK